jgi:hypothetical protein
VRDKKSYQSLSHPSKKESASASARSEVCFIRNEREKHSQITLKLILHMIVTHVDRRQSVNTVERRCLHEELPAMVKYKN